MENGRGKKINTGIYHHLKGKAAQDSCYRPSHEPQHQELDKDTYCGVTELRSYERDRHGRVETMVSAVKCGL